MMLTNQQTRKVRELLEAKLGELQQVLRRRDGIAIEKSADEMDAIQFALERDLEIRNVDRGYGLMCDVKAALNRVEAGTFGVCADCEEALSARRLAALPWAERCVVCQEIADREQDEGHDSLFNKFVEAA